MLSPTSSSRLSTSSSLHPACLTSSLKAEMALPHQTASRSIRSSRTRSSSPYTSKLSVSHILGSPDHPLSPMTRKQEPCTPPLRPIQSLIFKSPEFTVSRTCSGMVLVAPAPSKGPDSAGTAPTDLCCSRLGTGLILPYTRLVPFRGVLRIQQYLYNFTASDTAACS